MYTSTKDILRFFPENKHALLQQLLQPVEESTPRKLAQAIIEETISRDLARPDDYQQQVRNMLSRIVAQLLASVDGHFDQARHAFQESEAPLTRDVLRQKILEVMIPTPQGEESFGDIWQLLQETVTNSLLYQCNQLDVRLVDCFQQVEQEVLDVFLDHEQHSADLTFERALEMRRKALDAVSALIFDVSYGHLIDHKRYPQARTRYQAAYMALQLYDDVLDIFEDMRLGIGNVLATVASESGEVSCLNTVLAQIGSTDDMHPDYVFYLVSNAAPQSYRRLMQEQHTMIAQSGIKGEMWNGVRLPEQFDQRPMKFST
jgi:hypothetical protein